MDWFCYRFFRNRFFLSRLSREVEVDAEVEVSSRLCDWWEGGEVECHFLPLENGPFCDWWAGGDGDEFKPGDEVPEW